MLMNGAINYPVRARRRRLRLRRSPLCIRGVVYATQTVCAQKLRDCRAFTFYLRAGGELMHD
jgi:hypothetical protein